MSSTTKRASKSGSKSSSGSRSSSKNDDQKKSTSSKAGKDSRWTDWDWDEQYQREFRGLQKNDGEWEYQYRYPEQEDIPSKEIPRRLGLGPVQEEVAGITATSSVQGQSQSPASLSEVGANYTTTVASQQDSQMQPLDSAFGNMQLSPRLTHDDIPVYGRGAMNQTFPQQQVTRNPSGYTYSMAPVPTGSLLMSSSLQTDSSAHVQSSAGAYDTSHQYSAQPEQSGSVDTAEPLFISKQTQEERGLSDEPTLNKDFKLYTSKHFKFGKVFKILWTEPKGQGMPGNPKRTEAKVYTTKYGEEYYTSIRRFVIVRAYKGHCLCLKQATSKPGVKPENHAIIYTERKEKKGVIPREATGEAKLEYKPIRIEPKTNRDQLHELSRLNYAKIYTVEHNIKVCFIGRIHDSSKNDFVTAFDLQHQPLSEDSTIGFEEADVDEEYESEERDTVAPIP